MRGEDVVLQNSSLKALIAGRPIVSIQAAGRPVSDQDDDRPSSEVLLSFRQLQDLADYRSALQQWHGRTRIGDHLIIVVPHAFLYDRQLSLPSRFRPRQRRLYSPGSLLVEIEEALVPNSYRVRWLGDLDDGYDYALPLGVEPRGASDIALVLQSMHLPEWRLSSTAVPVSLRTTEPERIQFEPPRTRIEQDRRARPRRILILKLDHLGDLIMGIPALELARRSFPDAEIDLVVGSWNEAMARGLGVADRVIAFDAFPRNSSEEEPDVHATVGSFRGIVPDRYDLAIDLRVDTDTRILLRAANAPLKAGIGTHARFPFLDIALPLDSTRNEAERVGDDEIGLHGFLFQESARRTRFGLHSDKETVERDRAIFWGPYLRLNPGNYVFEFRLDVEEDKRGDGLLLFDIALNWGRQVAQMFVSGPGDFHLPFHVDTPDSAFEARAYTVEGHPSINFSFHGGRLVRRGAGNVLHQSEYAALLIELVRMRTQGGGMLQSLASA